MTDVRDSLFAASRILRSSFSLASGVKLGLSLLRGSGCGVVYGTVEAGLAGNSQ